jgi:hypothetical protein
MTTRDDNVLAALPGANELIEHYGTIPSFHDAEIISLKLSRKGSSTLTIQPFPPDKTDLVHFNLEDVIDLELADFSCQNVISSLSVEKRSVNNSKPALRIHLGACYGLCGWIEAEKISLELTERVKAPNQ